MRDIRVWIAAGLLLLAGRMIYPVVAGDRSTPVREEHRQKFVFVCRESGEIFVLRARGTNESHPRTGQPTLSPGLYCSECQKWRASPPVEVLQQNPSARMCATHRIPMTNQGPLPPAR
ncbi:MAG: hypothetical protein JSS49_12965 [Planctomycetes bacterium]|nr:hypothetical protein [Planctomycetota bacterium]